MGRFVKALVMTFLLMEITAIVALAAVWTVLSELHAAQSVMVGGIAIDSVGLGLITIIVFRRALAAEQQLQHEQPFDSHHSEEVASPASEINAVGPAHARGVFSANDVEHDRVMRRP